MTKSFADFHIVTFDKFLEVLLVLIEGSLEWFDIIEGMRHVLIRRAVKPSPSGGGYKAPRALRESKIKNHENPLRLQV